MVKVVIVGAGMGGIPLVLELKEELGSDAEVIVISERDQFNYTPSNAMVAVGLRQPEEIMMSVEPIIRKAGAKFKKTSVKKILPSKYKIVCESGEEIEYDFLVLATGAKLNFKEVEGIGPKSYSNCVYNIDDAVKAFDNLQEFEKNPGQAVIGTTDSKFCVWAAYEYLFQFDTELRKKGIRDKADITFVSPEPFVGHMGFLDDGEGRKIVETALAERDIKWIARSRIMKVTDDGVHVEKYDENNNHKSNMFLKSNFKMIIPSFRGVEMLQGMSGLVDEKGFVIVDQFQANPMFDNIFAVGVCAAMPPVIKQDRMKNIVKSGYLTEGIVTAVAKNIRLIIDGEKPRYVPNLGYICAADFGASDGIAFFALPHKSPRNVSLARRGGWVHEIKETYEKKFIDKIQRGTCEHIFEHYVLPKIGEGDSKE